MAIGIVLLSTLTAIASAFLALLLGLGWSAAAAIYLCSGYVAFGLLAGRLFLHSGAFPQR